MNTNAKRTKEVRDFEKNNEKMVIELATESIVLLKNDGLLPLKEKNIALYGGGACYTLKGGVGSGEVNPRKVTSIYDAFLEAGYRISTEDWLKNYIQNYENKKNAYVSMMRKKAGLFNFKVLNYLLGHPFNNPEDDAIPVDHPIDEVCFYVISRQAGENVDRLNEKKDYRLSDAELTNLRKCSSFYRSVCLIINVGGYIDLSEIQDLNIGSIVFYSMQGAAGAKALPLLINGTACFSGKLTATWTRTYDDVPFGSNFSILNGNTSYEDYQEGIYVGYKYYDSFQKEVMYPFGYGLSYTDFKIDSDVHTEGLNIVLNVSVKNIGRCRGKEVVQVYVKPPKGKLDKEYQRLAEFLKTDDLQPGETKQYGITIPLERLKSYDEESCQSVLEKGEYIIKVGNSSRNTKAVGKLILENTHVLYQHRKIYDVSFKELHSPYIEEEYDVKKITVDESLIQTVIFDYKDQYPFFPDKDLKNLTIKEKIALCSGDGLDIGLPKKHYFIIPGADAYTSHKVVRKGLPELAFCDGPTGVRLYSESREYHGAVRMTKPVMASFDFLPKIARSFLIKKPKENKMYYQYATNFPVGLALASSWSKEMMRKYARALVTEMNAFGCEHILAPSINIIRNPLCGRNYEYYSEDPLLSGLLAGEVIREIEKEKKLGSTVKHYLANNQEINRRYVSENVSDRALREIYFNNFSIAVKYGNPTSLMTSYNKVNGTYVCETKELVHDLLRVELGYQGLIMTDWVTTNYLIDSKKALLAGVNLMMPGIKSDYSQILKAYQENSDFMKYIDSSASLVIHRIKNSILYSEYHKK